MFGIQPPKSLLVVETTVDFDKDSDESEEREEAKPRGVSMFGSGGKGMSALEEAVARRRKQLENPDETADTDKNSEVGMSTSGKSLVITDLSLSLFQPRGRKPTKTSNDTL